MNGTSIYAEVSRERGPILSCCEAPLKLGFLLICQFRLSAPIFSLGSGTTNSFDLTLMTDRLLKLAEGCEHG